MYIDIERNETGFGLWHLKTRVHWLGHFSSPKVRLKYTCELFINILNIV